VIGLAVIAVGILSIVRPEILGRPPRHLAPLAVAAEQPVPMRVIDAGMDPPLEPTWVALERLEYMAGPWRTEDGTTLVSVVPKALAKVQNEPDALWRLTVERDHLPLITCGLYEGVQYANPPYTALPWRLGYCRGLSVDPDGPAVSARVSLLRSPGQEYLRLVLGAELDVEIFQVR
jgi:hypothetical protein